MQGSRGSAQGTSLNTSQASPAQNNRTSSLSRKTPDNRPSSDGVALAAAVNEICDANHWLFERMSLERLRDG